MERAHSMVVLEAQGIDTNQADNFIEVGFFLKDFHGGSNNDSQELLWHRNTYAGGPNKGYSQSMAGK